MTAQMIDAANTVQIRGFAKLFAAEMAKLADAGKGTPMTHLEDGWLEIVEVQRASGGGDGAGTAGARSSVCSQSEVTECVYV